MRVYFYLLFFIAYLGTIHSSRSQTTTSCFEISSILVDACGPPAVEGQNEMVRFLVGPNPLNTSSLNIGWASVMNSYDGICQNGTTAQIVSELNSTITSCGFVREPVNGVLPANAKVLLVTSVAFNPTYHSFANLADTLYMIFHCSLNTTGNFANTGTGIRTLTMSFNVPGGCMDQVSYDRSLLGTVDGSAVNYDFFGNATYVNYGCAPPVTPLDPSWTPPAGAICSTADPINLYSLVEGTQDGDWSGTGVTNGVFNPAGLNGAYEITYTVSIGACVETETHEIEVLASGESDWTPPASMCSDDASINLNNLITGTPGGAFSGTGVSNNTFNPSGLNGSIIITYSIGEGVCASSTSFPVQVSTSFNADWEFPESTICSSNPPINLNTLLTGSPGGTWSGTGVNGAIFNPAGLDGTFTITYLAGTGLCAATQAQSINVVDIGNASWNLPGPICSNAPLLNLSGLVTGTTSGIWTGSGITGNLFNPTGLNGSIPLTYSVGVGSCAASLTQSLEIVQAPNPSFAFTQTTICDYSSPINLNSLVSGLSGGTWSGTGVSGSTFSPASLNGNVSISYSVTQNGCTSSSSATIQVITEPSADWQQPGIQCESSAPINLNTLVTGLTGGTWSGNGVNSNVFNPLGNQGLNPVTYTVNVSGCTNSETKAIEVREVPPTPIMNGEATYCIGQSILPLTISNAGAYQVYWYTNSDLSPIIAQGTSYLPNITETTVFYSTLFNGTCSGEPSELSIEILPIPAIPQTQSPVIWCESTDAPVLNAISADSLTWFEDQNLLQVLGTGSSYEVSGIENRIFVAASNGQCNSLPFEVIIQRENLISASILGDTLRYLCRPASLNLSSADELLNRWSTGALTSTIQVNTGGTYVLTREGICNIAYDTVVVVDATVSAAFQIKLPIGLEPFPVEITSLSNNSDDCSWWLDQEEIEFPQGGILTFAGEGAHVLEQRCSNEFGCEDVQKNSFELKADLVQLFVPNAFTPNGDGVNDVFQCYTTGIVQLQMGIFNRWGEEIYLVKELNGFWNGKSADGRNAQDGVYLYKIDAIDKNGLLVRKKGSFTLIAYE